MAFKNSLLILITFLNTLLLVTGLCSVYASFHYELCKESFCYAIKTFTSFYETTFLYYGLMLTVFCVYGLIALFSDMKSLLETYAKLLVFLLVVLIIIFVMGFWGKGSIYLYSNMWTSFKAYGSDNSRVASAINDLQTKFKCCGITSPKDWILLQKQYKWNDTIPPASCCNSFSELPNQLKCRDIHQSGCFEPTHRYTLEFFNTLNTIGIILTLALICAISCTIRYTEFKDIDSESVQSPRNVVDDDPIVTSVLPERTLVLSQSEYFGKHFQTSTAV